VHAQSSFDYAVIRVVPSVEREEFLNAGVIVFCLQKKVLEARVRFDEERFLVLWPDLDVERVRLQLRAMCDICAGKESAGPIARLSQRERFHWLVSPRNTVIQVSAVHTGLADDASDVADRLLERLVPVR
jgi:Protein of unknown function (DUF3037)